MGYVQVRCGAAAAGGLGEAAGAALGTAALPLPPQAMKPPGAQGSQSTYTDLLSVIEEMGKEIRPTYAGSKSAMERLKRGRARRGAGGAARRGSPAEEADAGGLPLLLPTGIIHARALVRECLAETERNART